MFMGVDMILISMVIGFVSLLFIGIICFGVVLIFTCPNFFLKNVPDDEKAGFLFDIERIKLSPILGSVLLTIVLFIGVLCFIGCYSIIDSLMN